MRASHLGLSGNEYLRRQFAQEAATVGGRVTVEDFHLFAETFADLADVKVMKGALE